MKHQIWKYKLTETKVTLRMPYGAQLLTAQWQSGIADYIVLWALVDSSTLVTPATERTFEIHGTGHDIEDVDSLFYIATAQEGDYVYHIFERLNK